jgi:hypothetical protein
MSPLYSAPLPSKNNDAAVTTDGNTVGEQEIYPGRSDPVIFYPVHEKTPRESFYPCFQESLASTFSTIPYTSDPLLCIGLAVLERMRWTETAPSWFIPRLAALSGTNLRSNLCSNVTAVSGLKADLSNGTVMTLRASYASVMFRAFRRGRIPGQTAE